MVSGSLKLTFNLLTVYLVIKLALPSARWRHFLELKCVFAFFSKTTRGSAPNLFSGFFFFFVYYSLH